MKKIIFLFLVITACNTEKEHNLQSLSLGREWNSKLIHSTWVSKKSGILALFGETIKLPGSMTENGKGDVITLKTPWTVILLTNHISQIKKYEKYRVPGNIKIPFWLKPVKYYKGAAWYQKELRSLQTGKG